MTKREFITAYNRAQKAYHANANNFDHCMDALVQDCTDTQWNAVRILAEQGYPEIDSDGNPTRRPSSERGAE